MSLTINTNIASLNTAKELGKAIKDTNSSFEKLSSGKRINKASDDPAGLAVALDLLAQADTGRVAARNISDGVSALSIAEGSLESVSSITTRLAELSTQASNGTLSAEQRTALNSEYQSLTAELDRIASTTEFNGQKLLNGSSTITIQAGTDGSPSAQIGTQLPGVSAAALGLTADLSSQESARLALDQTKAATSAVASSRAEIGASESRLQTAFDNLKTSELNQRQAASRITDVDVAEESTRLVANRIRTQASLSILASANAQPQNVLKLLG